MYSLYFETSKSFDACILFYSDVWKIILCTICKTRGTHYLCSNLRNIEKWYCFRCKELEGNCITIIYL